MSLLVVKTILLINSLLQITQTTDYCELDCTFVNTTYKNTVCERNNSCGPIDDCKEMELNDTFRQWIVDIHNDLRNKIAIGNETRQNITSASNMNILNYDKNLEYVAKCHINRCTSDHDICHSTKKYQHVGQNIYSGVVLPPINSLDHIRATILDWYKEIELIEPNTIDKFDGNLKIAHFTQVIWAETTHLGCAISKSIKLKILYFVCNYGPTGNILDEPVYERGEPCTECDERQKCNKEYLGLCGESPRLIPTHSIINNTVECSAQHPELCNDHKDEIRRFTVSLAQSINLSAVIIVIALIAQLFG